MLPARALTYVARILCRRPNKRCISSSVSSVAMAEQILFSRAVVSHFPAAIPTQLERVDEFTVGKVFIYHKRPRFLLPWRKHKLDFTGYPLADLLVQGSSFKFATGRKFLVDIAKGVETVDTELGMDVELKEALTHLNMKVKGKYSHQHSITTDFGKITHIETDLYDVLSAKAYTLDTHNPIVREAIAKGSAVFVISAVYEAEHSNISMKLSRSESETVGGGATVHGIGGDADETVAHSDSDVQVTNRDIPTPIALLLLKLTIGRRGQLRPKLRSGLDNSTKVELPFGLYMNIPPTKGTDSPQQ